MQEWPQLLDPYLSTYLPPLVEAFLEFLGKCKDDYTTKKCRPGFIPLSRAISWILYSLCKIRGRKVITQFYNNEPRYLEPMVDAFTRWDASHLENESPGSTMRWEERYVMLQWLSHLMLTPFDLASVSSEGVSVSEDSRVLRDLPPGIPRISRSLVAMSVKYLTVAGKEREAASAMLVRLALRPDMRRMGLLEYLLNWALESMQSLSSGSVESSTSTYGIIGVLSFVYGICNSGEGDIVAPYLVRVFNTLERVRESSGSSVQNIGSSAAAQKLIIKTYRAIMVMALQLETSGKTSVSDDWVSSSMEDVIDHLLTDLAATDTPVRFAASKAISIITLKLDPAMAGEIVAAVTGSLAENVLWEDPATGKIVTSTALSPGQNSLLRRNLSAVSAPRWQGLMLTLAHLLFRRSPPADDLPEILLALVSALDFEQRLSTGTAVGTGVRDAACFGIWSLARKYSTTELRAVPPLTITSTPKGMDVDVPQQLAVELVIAASCDPSGNIRRGSSAALQELIGRHPDTILEGISLVQIVDYHAIALRARAMTEVGTSAAKLDYVYWVALLGAILGWRGVGSPDPASRRTAAVAVGLLAQTHGHSTLAQVLETVMTSIRQLKPGDVELRHGLLLSLAKVVDATMELLSTNETAARKVRQLPALKDLWNEVDQLLVPLQRQITTSSMRPQLTAEACCELISALSRASSGTGSDELALPPPSSESLASSLAFISSCFTRGEDAVIQASSSAVLNLFSILDDSKKTKTISSWIADLRLGASSVASAGRSLSLVVSLGAVFRCFDQDVQSGYSPIQRDILLSLLKGAEPSRAIEHRVAALNSITTGILSHKGRPISVVVTTVTNHGQE